MRTDIYLGTIKNTFAKVLGKWAAVYNTLNVL